MKRFSLVCVLSVLCAVGCSQAPDTATGNVNNTTPATATRNTNGAAQTAASSSPAAPSPSPAAQPPNQATAQEQRELLQLIATGNEDVEAAINDLGGTADAINQLQVRKLDLNGDGQPEYIVVLEHGGLCGALANCPGWVYRKTGDRYELLLRTRGRELLLQQASTNGYRDLRSEGGDTATRSSYAIYQFDGSRYRARQCFSRESSGGREVERPINCAGMEVEGQ